MIIIPNTAYVDPSVVTYGVQALAGIIIAAAAVFVVFWRKAKKKVADKLGLEEKTKKEVEADLELVATPANQEKDETGKDDSAK